MKLEWFKATWGMDGQAEEQLERIAKAGYQGAEVTPAALQDKSGYRRLLDRYELKSIAQVHTGGGAHDAAAHFQSFEQLVRNAAELGPLKINSQSARDTMTWDEQCFFFEKALKLEQELGVLICHETHRGRPLFTPWTTARLLKTFPELHLTADFSHWFCVCESLLQDQREDLLLACQHAQHIHARVGYQQGPQVPHPAAPEYAQALAAHEALWQQIVQLRQANGAKTLTITPEFGPPGYMHTLPFTNRPVADLWEVCLWMRDHLQQKLA